MHLREALEAEMSRVEGILVKLNPDNDYLYIQEIIQALDIARQDLATDNIPGMRIDLEALKKY